MKIRATFIIPDLSVVVDIPDYARASWFFNAIDMVAVKDALKTLPDGHGLEHDGVRYHKVVDAPEEPTYDQDLEASVEILNDAIQAIKEVRERYPETAPILVLDEVLTKVFDLVKEEKP